MQRPLVGDIFGGVICQGYRIGAILLANSNRAIDDEVAADHRVERGGIGRRACLQRSRVLYQLAGCAVVERDGTICGRSWAYNRQPSTAHKGENPPIARAFIQFGDRALLGRDKAPDSPRALRLEQQRYRLPDTRERQLLIVLVTQAMIRINDDPEMREQERECLGILAKLYGTDTVLMARRAYASFTPWSG